MFRESWRSGRYWLWLWRDRVPAEVRVGGLIVLTAATLWVGWLAADGLSSANAGTSSSSGGGAQALIDARSLRVTVRKSRVYTVTRMRTIHDQRVVTAPGQVRTVTVPVTKNVNVVRNRTVPVLSTRVLTVTAPGRTSTDVLTRTKTETMTVTTPAVTVTQTVVPAPITVVITVTVPHK